MNRSWYKINRRLKQRHNLTDIQSSAYNYGVSNIACRLYRVYTPTKVVLFSRPVSFVVPHCHYVYFTSYLPGTCCHPHPVIITRTRLLCHCTVTTPTPVDARRTVDAINMCSPQPTRIHHDKNVIAKTCRSMINTEPQHHHATYDRSTHFLRSCMYRYYTTHVNLYRYAPSPDVVHLTKH